MTERQWDGKTRGGTLGQRSLFFMFRILNIRVGYFMLYIALPFFFLSRPDNFRAIKHYFNKRLGFSKFRSFFLTIQNYHIFGKVVLDKFYLLSGAKNPFVVNTIGIENYQQLLTQDAGFMMVGSHIGNFEIAGYLLKATNKPINAVIFGGESAEFQKNRGIKLSSNNIKLIPVSSDMSHLFAIKAALSNGEIVSMPSDRIFGSSKSVSRNFLGAEAKFPLGPFLTAVQLNVEILAVFVMKESGLKYSIFVQPITVDPVPDEKPKLKAERLASKYIAELEKVVKKYPKQWFNYYEFWNQ